MDNFFKCTKKEPQQLPNIKTIQNIEKEELNPDFFSSTANKINNYEQNKKEFRRTMNELLHIKSSK
jgi:hypothetical protein